MAAKRAIALHGWRADAPDARDWTYQIPGDKAGLLPPPKVDLRGRLMPPIFNQGMLGSCTANATNALIEYLEKKAGQKQVRLSRLYTYYKTREAYGDVAADEGATLRDTIKTIAKYGSCNENIWPYDIGKYDVRPPKRCEQYDRYHQALEYARVPQSHLEIKTCLADGLPIVFGFAVYESFYNADNARKGLMPMPKAGERLEGYHAVKIVGYDDAIQRYIIRNSWGVNYHDNGHFYMPYEFLIDPDYCADFWTVRKVS